MLIALTTRCLLAGTLLLAAISYGQTPAAPFRAKALLALSDADMVPSAYVDGRLGPPAGHDALTVLSLGGALAGRASMRTLPLSNSVTGPPAAMALTPDGRYALTIETRSPRATDTAATLAGLRNGRTISVIDVHDPRRPRIVQQVAGPARALSVAVSADGSLVALAVHPEGDGATTPLWLYRFANGRLSAGKAVAIPGWTPGHELVTAIFHPRRSMLALTDKTQPQLLLAEVRPVGSGWQLRTWGSAVPLVPGILLTCFSPDGRYFFTNGGPAPEAPSRGLVLSVRLGSGINPVHAVVARGLTGFIPEGLAVSPDGRLLVTTNLEQTYQPVGHPQRGRYASLSLFAVDPASGALTAAGEFTFDGMLPESAVFDGSSRHLAVANYGQLANPTGSGSIDFWQVTGTPGGPVPLRLLKTSYSVPVQRGVHTLAVVR